MVVASKPENHGLLEKDDTNVQSKCLLMWSDITGQQSFEHTNPSNSDRESSNAVFKDYSKPLLNNLLDMAEYKYLSKAG